MKKLSLLLVALIISQNAFAAGYGIAPSANQTVTSIGGVNASQVIVPLRVDSNGNIVITDNSGTISATRITISASGATDRTQGSTLTVNSCTFLSLSSNTGTIYAGGSTVTNNSGSNKGFPMIAGSSLGPVSMTNLNQIYFATDTANNVVAVFCN